MTVSRVRGVAGQGEFAGVSSLIYSLSTRFTTEIIGEKMQMLSGRGDSNGKGAGASQGGVGNGTQGEGTARLSAVILPAVTWPRVSRSTSRDACKPANDRIIVAMSDFTNNQTVK
jgi:single-stranded DNA-binding protein